MVSSKSLAYNQVLMHVSHHVVLTRSLTSMTSEGRIIDSLERRIILNTTDINLQLLPPP